MEQRCLLIADDLTGGADAGAQFAKRGLRTLLLSLKTDTRIDLATHDQQDVLVVNTGSRGLSPEHAHALVSSLLKNDRETLFPVIYKKIDSTLRGNIGYEIDAILEKTNGSLCFVAPSYPEQNRTLVGGILIVGERPLALTEVARNTPSPVQESHVHKILQKQSRFSIGGIDLTHVASTQEGLQKAVAEAERRGNRIIIFDAVSRQDLTNVAEVGFSLKKKPFFVGSAGLAEEVAKKIAPSARSLYPKLPGERVFKHLFVVSGTSSSVTHQQLARIEQRGIPSFLLNKYLLTSDESEAQAARKEIVKKISMAISQGGAILKVTQEMLRSEKTDNQPIHLKIVKTLAEVTLLSLERSAVSIPDIALILTGGETAQNVTNALGNDGIAIEGELLGGIVKGHLVGGKWSGLSIVTKAGAFGKEDALEKIVNILGKGTPFPKEEG